MRRIGRHEQGVTVRLGFGHELGANLRVGASPVVDQHRLLQALTELLGNNARYGIRAAGSGKGTTIVIGAEGYVWLIAAEAANKLAARVKTRGKIFMEASPVVIRMCIVESINAPQSSPAQSFASNPIFG